MKLKLLPYKRYSGEEIKQKAINEQWVGQGTPDNPYLIESTHSFSQHSVIRDSSQHIVIRNCSFESLTLNRCINFKLEKCSFEVLQLLKCSDIELDNCSCNMRLDLVNSHNLKIVNSTIDLLEIIRCYENHLKVCEITQIHNRFSRANTFENISPPVQNIDDIMRLNPKKYLLKTIGFPIAGIILLLLAIIRFINTFTSLILWSLIGGIFLMIFIILMSTITHVFDFKKMQKYPPNTIL